MWRRPVVVHDHTPAVEVVDPDPEPVGCLTALGPGQDVQEL